MYKKIKTFQRQTMATLSKMKHVETDLILTHNKLVRTLEMEYTNHICQLLKQKSTILNNLQQQFIEQRNKIKQTLSNQHVAHHMESKNLSLSNDPSITEKMAYLSQDLSPENDKNYTEIQVNPTEIGSCSAANETIWDEDVLGQSRAMSGNALAIERQKEKNILHVLPSLSKKYSKKSSIAKQKPKRSSNSTKSKTYKKHKCPHCEYSTNRKADLKRHSRTLNIHIKSQHQ